MSHKRAAPRIHRAVKAGAEIHGRTRGRRYREPEYPCGASQGRRFAEAHVRGGAGVCGHQGRSTQLRLGIAPGRGVTTGAGAQEESLCRCSTLYSCLTDQKMRELFYEPHRRNKTALHTDDCIYTPGVTVFKTDVSAPELLGEMDWYSVDVITCAAPNLRYGDVSITDEELKQLHIKRLRRILDIAILNKVENIVLGAFGCGAFMNDPKVVAAASAEVIKDYLFAFKTIEFAVFCRPGFEQNYREFRNYLGSE
ncbi:MAG: TIGR02452 family protein [Fibrobacter sp.]|nr:TIGR02452 family protein [Fibrobacter sp.]MDD5941787.1 TIGR02452 family protein [Fibrobacter sp.]